MTAIKVIKKDKIKKAKAVKPVCAQTESETATRAMISTVAGWVNELRDEQRTAKFAPDHFVSNSRRFV